jgi:hypothetical protein
VRSLTDSLADVAQGMEAGVADTTARISFATPELRARSHAGSAPRNQKGRPKGRPSRRPGSRFVGGGTLPVNGSRSGAAPSCGSWADGPRGCHP